MRKFALLLKCLIISIVLSVTISSESVVTEEEQIEVETLHDSRYEQTEAEEHIRRRLLLLPNQIVEGIPEINPSLSSPWGAWRDTAGNLFVSDTNVHKIFMLSPSNILTTFAGTGVGGFSGDGGPASAAKLLFPASIWGDRSGNNIFICDMGNSRVRRIARNNNNRIQTIVGGGSQAVTRTSIAGTTAKLTSPIGLWINPAGSIFLVDSSLVYRALPVTGAYNVQLYAGGGTRTGQGSPASTPIPSLQLLLRSPNFLTGDSNGNLYISDFGNNVIRKIDRLASSTVIAGQVGQAAGSFATGSPATSVKLRFPRGIWVDSTGDIFFTDGSNHIIGVIDGQNGQIARIAGVFGQNGGAGRDDTGTAFGNGGNALNGFFSNPGGIVGDTNGILYIADRFHSSMRKIVPVQFFSPTQLPTRAPTRSPTITPTLLPTQSPTLDLLWNDIIQVIMGTGTNGNAVDGGQATSTSLNTPLGVWVDSTGNTIYVCEQNNFRVRRISTTSGIVSTIAGNGVSSNAGTSPGQGTATSLFKPFSVKGDATGEKVYISDNLRIWEYSLATGTITVLAGATPTNAANYGDGGSAASAAFSSPAEIWLSSSASFLLVADPGHSRIRRIDLSTKIITTFAGTDAGFAGDNGQATSAKIQFPFGVWGDSAGNTFIADTFNNRIRIVNSAGIIKTFAGTGTSGYSGNNGPATSATLASPTSVVGDSEGNIFIGDLNNCAIRLVSKDTGIITSFVGAGPSQCGTSQSPVIRSPSALTNSPAYLAVDGNTNLYFTEAGTGNLRRVLRKKGSSSSVSPTTSPTAAPTFSSIISGNVELIMGTGVRGNATNGGTATSTPLNGPMGILVDGKTGNVMICDQGAGRIFMVNPQNTVRTLAGTGKFGFQGGAGAATSIDLYHPMNIKSDSTGNNYYFTDNFYVWKYTVSTGNINVFAGKIPTGFAGDGGLATSASFSGPMDLWISSNNDQMYITDLANNRIRRINMNTNIISTFAGSGAMSYSGDNGLATNAALHYPYGVWGDSVGNVYIADTFNSRVRIVNINTNIIRTFAGNGIISSSGDNGPATSASLMTPVSVVGDKNGRIFISDTVACTIRMVANGMITTFLGKSGQCGSSQGTIAASSALLKSPAYLSLDSNERLYWSDNAAFNARRYVP